MGADQPGDLEPRPATLPTIGGAGLVYPGKRHVFSGPPESAKTLAAYAIALEEIRPAATSILIDFEMGPWDARDRLRDSAPPTTTSPVPLRRARDTGQRSDRRGTADRRKVTLAIIDAAAGAYALQGSTTTRARRGAFARLYVQAFWLRGIATLVLDHVSKNARAAARSRSAPNARSAAPTSTSASRPCCPSPVAAAALQGQHPQGSARASEATESRRPRAPLRPGHERARLDVPAARGADRRHAVAADAVHAAGVDLARNDRVGSAHAVSRRKVRERHGTAYHVDQAIDALLVEGYVAETAGTSDSRPVYSVRAYREPSVSDRVGTASRHGQDDPSATASVSAPPIRADAPTRCRRRGRPATSATSSSSSSRSRQATSPRPSGASSRPSTRSSRGRQLLDRPPLSVLLADPGGCGAPHRPAPSRLAGAPGRRAVPAQPAGGSWVLEAVRAGRGGKQPRFGRHRGGVRRSRTLPPTGKTVSVAPSTPPSTLPRGVPETAYIIARGEGPQRRFLVRYKLGGRESAIPQHAGSYRRKSDAVLRRNFLIGLLASGRPDEIRARLRSTDTPNGTVTRPDAAERWQATRVDVAAGTRRPTMSRSRRSFPASATSRSTRSTRRSHRPRL